MKPDPSPTYTSVLLTLACTAVHPACGTASTSPVAAAASVALEQLVSPVAVMAAGTAAWEQAATAIGHLAAAVPVLLASVDRQADVVRVALVARTGPRARARRREVALRSPRRAAS